MGCHIQSPCSNPDCLHCLHGALKSDITAALFRVETNMVLQNYELFLAEKCNGKKNLQKKKQRELLRYHYRYSRKARELLRHHQ